MMKPEVKKEWVAALRSGEYTQGTQRLQKTLPGGAMQHCCLGVLCVLAEKSGVEMGHAIISNGVDGPVIGTVATEFNGTSTHLPYAVKAWAGLRHMSPYVKTRLEDDLGVEETDYCLTDLNDNGQSFAQIANLIEASEEL